VSVETVKIINNLSDLGLTARK